MAVFFKCSRFLRLSPAHIPYRLLSCSPTSANRKGLVLGVYADESNDELILTPAAEQFNKTVNCELINKLKLIDTIKEGKSYIFYGLHDFQAVAVVGLGKKCKGYDSLETLDKDKEAVRVAAAAGCRSLEDVGIKTICVEELGDVEAAGEGSTLGLWKFQECKTKQKYPPKVDLYFGKADCHTELFQSGVIKANAQNLARHLTDMPSNLMTPTIFTQQVEEAFKGLDVVIEVHDDEWARKKNMGAFLAVAQGSCEPPKFLELSYNKGVPNNGPYILVGKGVTFDSGGISLKPASKMDEMRGDMGGAAAVTAALQALACLNAPANIKVLVPLTENMPSGKAIKPGDVVKAMNGKTIAINNTDAEGRLILCDALTYSSCFKPSWVMDVCTLTGAMRVALGGAASGVFTNSDKLYKCLEKAGAVTGDRVWRMPLWNHYTKEMVEYPGYDLSNIGKSPGGGACTAAAFLREFMPPETDWLHMDIAGVSGPGSSEPYLTKGMTGRPTRTIIEFIDAQSRVFEGK